MNFKKDLVAHILLAMKANKISQVDLAKRTGVSKQAVHIWLRTDSVSIDKLLEVAEIVGLKVNVSYEWGDIDNN